MPPGETKCYQTPLLSTVQKLLHIQSFLKTTLLAQLFGSGRKKKVTQKNITRQKVQTCNMLGSAQQALCMHLDSNDPIRIRLIFMTTFGHMQAM